MKKLLVVFSMLAVAFVMQAQIVPLDSCLAWAKNNNAQMRMSRNEIEAAKEVQGQVFTKFFPQIDATAFGFYAVNPLVSFDISRLPQTEIGHNLLDAIYEFLRETFPDETFSQQIDLMQKGYSFGGKVVQPVYAGGRIVAGYQLSKLGVQAAEAKHALSERDLLQEVEGTYWLVSGLQEKRATLQAVTELLDTLSNVANTAYEAGVVTRNDLLLVELKKGEMQTKSLQLENGIRLATKLLCLQTGHPYEGDMLLQALDTIDVLFAPSDTFLIENRPEHELLELNVKAEQLRRRMSLGEALPMIALAGFGGFSNLYDRPQGNFVALLTVSVPLTQWWETSRKLKEHDLRIRSSEIMREDLTEKMRLQNEQVYSQLVESAQLIRQNETSLQLARENFRLMLLNYESGMATMSELLESQVILYQVQNDCTDARISFRTALRKFNDYNR